MATKPAPRITVDLSKEIPAAMAKESSNGSYRFKEILWLLDGQQITYTHDEVVNGLTSAEQRGDLRKCTLYGELVFELTPEFRSRWTEPGH